MCWYKMDGGLVRGLSLPAYLSKYTGMFLLLHIPSMQSSKALTTISVSSF